jgi:signal transduction histidine kinase
VASLKLYLDTLRLRELDEERRQAFYLTMEQDLERLHSTINNVLNAAMYTERKVEDPQSLDFARLTRRAIDLTRTRHQLPEGAIRYEGPESLVLQGQPIGLETAVLNLLDNAVKYSRERVEVEVEVGRNGDGQVHLRVKDTGIGMTRTHLRFVFNRFYRIGSEARRNRPGTGLGLFIVRSVVKGHGGTVMADSPGPDRGSTFVITLPGLHDATPEA